MNIKKIVEGEKSTLITFRRYLHEHPELSQKEFKTMDYIEDHLHEWNIRTVRVPRGGVLGFLDGKGDGASVLMRADIDALPIQEDLKNLGHERVCISQNKGVMHACGHDGHTSMLLTDAKILADHRDEWSGHVIFMFEEAEEMGFRGVGPLLTYLHDHHIKVDYCFGTHVLFNIPSGKIGIRYGAMLAGAYFFRVQIHGVGGHGSMPHMAKSPIETFVSFASELRSYPMRMIDPSHHFTYSFGGVNAGKEPNIIPSELEFAGTARFTNNDDGLAFRKAMHDLLAKVNETYGTTYTFIDDQYFPVTSNHVKELVDLAARAIDENVGPHTVDMDFPVWMAAETFSITESVYPGVFVFTGIKNDAVGSGAPHHTPEFDIDEAGLVTGVEAALSYVLTVLKEQPKVDFKPGDLKSMLKLV